MVKESRREVIFLKLDLVSFIVGSVVGMLMDFGGSFVAGHYLYKEHLDKKRTGGSFRESYEDNKGGDDNDDLL